MGLSSPQIGYYKDVPFSIGTPKDTALETGSVISMSTISLDGALTSPSSPAPMENKSRALWSVCQSIGKTTSLRRGNAIFPCVRRKENTLSTILPVNSMQCQKRFLTASSDTLLKQMRNSAAKSENAANSIKHGMRRNPCKKRKANAFRFLHIFKGKWEY